MYERSNTTVAFPLNDQNIHRLVSQLVIYTLSV